jgi:hypothetical protein
MSQRSERLTRRDRLDRLRIHTPCAASWDQMQGDDRERFCARCHKSVVDFSQLTPREIDARLQASRGNLCARLSRTAAGRLVTLAAPPESWATPLDRPSPAAAVAAVVTALLGSSGALAQGGTIANEPAASAVAVSESPLEADRESASMTVDALTAEDPGAQGVVTETITMGAMVAVAEPLREVYAESPVVVFALAGPTRVLENQGGWGEVETELRIQEVLKGRVHHSSVRYRHYEPLPAAGEEARFSPAPDAEVLAFLTPREFEEGRRSGRVFDPTDAMFGVRVLTSASRAAYRERLADLEWALRSRVVDPGALAAWLVETAEEPETRGEVMAELSETTEPLSDRQRGRLGEALAATRRLTEADLALAELVRQWAPEDVTAWLLREARVALTAPRPAPESDAPDVSSVWYWGKVAAALGIADLEAVAGAAQEEVSSLYTLSSEDEAEQESLRTAIAAVEDRLRLEFARRLDRED